MNWRKIFKLRGLNIWIIGSTLGWNLLAGLALLIIGFQVLRMEQGGFDLIQILLIVGAFVIAAFGGYFAGKIAGDGRGPAYGVYGSLSGAAVFMYVLLSSGGLLGLIVASSAIFGGLNGGILSIRKLKMNR